jgi:nitrite reductase (NADH) small subunit
VKHELFPLDELSPGQLRAATIDAVAIVVVRTPEGDVHALRDVCPHHGARLSRGMLERTVGGDELGVYDLLEGYTLRCPWHGYEFDVATGRCLADERQRVRSYSVTVEDGIVVVER